MNGNMIHLQMVGELIFFVLLMLMLALYAFISRLTMKPFKITTPKKILVPTERRKGVIVVFGASGVTGIATIKALLKENYNVVGMGRQYGRWVETVNGEKLGSYLQTGQLQWQKVDVRLHREIRTALEATQKVLGKIDACINASVIKPNFDPLVDTISTALDGSDISVRLPGAYSDSYRGRYDLYREGTPGNENSFFTNLVGLLNLNRIEQEMAIGRIVNPANIDPLSDALTKLLTQLDPHRTITISFDDIEHIVIL